VRAAAIMTHFWPHAVPVTNMAGKTRKVCKWELTNQILYHSPVKHDAVTSLLVKNPAQNPVPIPRLSRKCSHCYLARTNG